MRNLQLSLIVLVSAFFYAKGIPEFKCVRDGKCTLPIKPELIHRQQIDSIADALNSNAITTSFLNTTTTYVMSTGVEGTLRITEESTYQQFEGYMLETLYIVSEDEVSSGDQVVKITTLLYSTLEITSNEGIVSFTVYGEGAVFEGDESTFVGNVTQEGAGRIVQMSPTELSTHYGLFETMNTAETFETDAISFDYTEVADNDKLIVRGTEAVLTTFMVPSQGTEQKSTLNVNLQGEAPLLGESGPVSESTEGKIYEESSDPVTITTQSDGYLLMVEEGFKTNSPMSIMSRLRHLHKH